MLEAIINGVKAWIDRLWPAHPVETYQPAPVRVSDAPAVKRAPRRKREPLHLTEILDGLPKCRKLMAATRKVDKDAYQFWKVFGAKIAIDGQSKGVMPKTIPSVGMIVDFSEDSDLFDGTFIYFNQVETRPWDSFISPGATAVYQCCVAFGDVDGKAWAYEFHIAISAEGDIEVPIRKQTQYQRLKRGGGISHVEWGVPSGLKFHCEDWCARSKEKHSPVELGALLFASAVTNYDTATDDFQVRAERGSDSVAFNVALGRTPDFFRERETGLAADGKRRRIFHAVKEHSRNLEDGKTSTVKAHYRGERQFFWKGENITITPAERSLARTFNVVAIEGDQRAKLPAGYVRLGSHAKVIRAAVESEWRKTNRAVH